MSNLESSSGSTSSSSPWSCNSLLCIHEERSWVPQLSLPSSSNSLNAFLKSFFLMSHRYLILLIGFVTLTTACRIHWPFLRIIFITIERLNRRGITGIIYKLLWNFSNICYRNGIKLHSPLYWFLPLLLHLS